MKATKALAMSQSQVTKFSNISPLQKGIYTIKHTIF